ncbi:hypothetical protein SAMN05421858_4452 [Haladaptatus litoreus]|uniref:Uncharacterized protein n=1 Tax=Haladaptatus litoreus TaxID=553468 RepID=A0A1N7ENX0_9EURY|nr:hypothetical protein [Haladaptatus litoreus]SIR89788.1 hypothetical protein SAMN05421858_4452 [Haladaptatus litoreus]
MEPSITNRKLPAGWAHSPHRGDGFGGTHESAHFELRAEPIDVRANRPEEAQWELNLVHQIKDEYKTNYLIGYVATKQKAINQIVYLMKRLNEELKLQESIRVFNPQDFISHLDIKTHSDISFEKITHE